MAVASVTQPAHGTATDADTHVTYTPDGDYCNDPPGGTPDTFTYTLNGGSQATVSVTVTCLPDAPTIDTSTGSTSYTENAAPVAVDAAVTIANPDGLVLTGGTVAITAGAGGQDALDWTDNDAGDGITEGASSATSVVLTGNGTSGEYQAALRAVTFANSSENPSSTARTVTFSVTTAAGSPDDTKQVDVVPVDDPPTADDDSATVVEDSGANAVAVLANDDDVDGGTMTISAASDPANGTVVLTGPVGARTGLTYQPDADYCNDPNANPEDTFTYTLSPGGDQGTVAMTVTCVNDAPQADDDPFGDALGNTRFVVGTTSTGPRLTVAGDVLTGDTDVDTPTANLTAGPGTITSTQCIGVCAGNVTMEADGQFTYDPRPGFTGSDTFTYTVSDNDSQSPANQTDTGTVTITVVGPVVWYVDGDSVATGDGRSHSPANSLSALSTGGGLDSIDGPGDVVFVYDAASSYAGGLVLEASQSLIGQPHSLDVDPAGSTPLQSDLVAAGGSNPVVVNASGNALTLATGNTVQGISLGSTPAANASLAGASIGTATVNTVTGGSINNTTGKAVDVSVGTLNATFASISSGGGTAGIALNGVDGTLVGNAGTLSGATGALVDINSGGGSFSYAGTIGNGSGLSAEITNRTGGSVTLSGAVSDTNDTGGGIVLSGNSGGTTTFSGSSKTIDTGAANTEKAISISSGAGSTTVFSNGGLNADTSNGTGLDLDNPGAVTVSGAGNSVDASGSGTGIDVNAGSGTISVNAAGETATGQVAEVTNRTGGAVTLSGALTDSGTSTGIDVTGNSAGSTVDFTGGGLDLSTGANTGFNATGGTVTVTGSGNRLAATTGTALSVSGATIGANDLTFEAISAGTGAGSAGVGINLVNTGSTGGLHVTGTGTPGSGGTIQHKTGADGSTTGGIGVFLQNTADVQLARMQLNDFDNYAIRGLGVDGMTLSSSVVNGTNGSSTALDEGAVVFGVRAGTTGLTGTASVTGTTISGGAEDNLGVYNASGTVGLTVSGSTITNAGNDGLSVELHTTATANVGIQGSTFTDNVGDHVNTTANGAANLNVLAGTTTANTLSTSAGAYASVLGGSFVVQTGGQWSGTGSANISNNTITFAKDTPLNVNIGGTGTFGATVQGNVIGTSGVASSGTAGNEDAIRIVANGDKGALGAGANGGTLNALVSNNTLQQVSGRGIFVIGRDGGSAGDPIQLNVTIQGNLLRESPSSGGQGIRLESGASSTPTPDHVTLHANIGGAGALANVFPDNWGSNLPSGTDFHEIRITHNITGGNRFILTGYAGSGTDMSAVGAYLAGRNTLPGGGTASATVGGGNSYENGGNPPTP
jgi:hypothetical protein